LAIAGLPPGPIPTAQIPTLWYDELDSTNAFARRLAEEGQAGPMWIAARRQSAGRGRRGRSWETGQSNLAATFLGVTDRPPIEAAQLSFVVALAVRDFAAAYVPETLLKLKWPNDVLLGGDKLAGILIESGRRPDGRLWLAAGVGVNLASAPSGVEFPATALAAHLKAGVAAPPKPEAALEALSGALVRRLAEWDEGGFGPTRDAWRAAALGLGAPCQVRLADRTLPGVAEDLDQDGALLLRLASGKLERITAGDVFFGAA
jgi:BirA family biotin operon repressor/biotin-[acetyl-CoA-carboxylase] ligase